MLLDPLPDSIEDTIKRHDAELVRIGVYRRAANYLAGAQISIKKVIFFIMRFHPITFFLSLSFKYFSKTTSCSLALFPLMISKKGYWVIGEHVLESI